MSDEKIRPCPHGCGRKNFDSLGEFLGHLPCTILHTAKPDPDEVEREAARTRKE